MKRTAARSQAPVDLIFDGHCGFCTRAVGWIGALDRQHRITAHAYQHPGVLRRFGLTTDQARSAVWVVSADESMFGAHAIARALDIALGVRVFTAIYHLPGIRAAQGGVYQWVADHRQHFPGVTPWCQQHPGQCGG